MQQKAGVKQPQNLEFYAKVRQLKNRHIKYFFALVTVFMGEEMTLMENANQLAEYQKTETMLRDENHAEIVATIKDAPGAQAALTDSIAELNAFQKESGMIPKEPREFMQTCSHDVELPEAPATWDSS